jgi:hypothetical protein
MRTKRNANRILVGKPEGKRPRRRCVDNIKMGLRKSGRGDMAYDREQWRALVNTVMNLPVP